MNYLDIGLIFLLVIGFFSGLRTGLVKGAFSLVGLVLGVWFAGRFYTSFTDATIGRVITFIIIFLVVAVVVSLVGKIVSKIVHLVLLGWLDHLLGAVLGVVSASVFIALILAAYLQFLGPSNLITDSAVSRLLLSKLPLVLALLPGTFRDTVKPFFY